MTKGDFSKLAQKQVTKVTDSRLDADPEQIQAFTGKSGYIERNSETPPPPSVKRGRKPKAQGEKGETYTFRLQPKFINELDDKLESLPRHITRTDLVRLAFSIVSNMPTNQIIEMLKNEELELAQEQDGE